MAGKTGGGETDPSKASNGDANNGKTSKISAQMQKMRDANTKYKNLLKMAKERIEQQENELKEMRGKPADSRTNLKPWLRGESVECPVSGLSLTRSILLWIYKQRK